MALVPMSTWLQQAWKRLKMPRGVAAAGFAEAEEEAIMAGGKAAPALDSEDGVPLKDLFSPGKPAKPAPCTPQEEGRSQSKMNVYAAYGHLPH